MHNKVFNITGDNTVNGIPTDLEKYEIVAYWMLRYVDHKRIMLSFLFLCASIVLTELLKHANNIHFVINIVSHVSFVNDSAPFGSIIRRPTQIQFWIITIDFVTLSDTF